MQKKYIYKFNPPSINAQMIMATEDKARDRVADQRLPSELRPQMANRSAGSSSRMEMMKVR